MIYGYETDIFHDESYFLLLHFEVISLFLLPLLYIYYALNEVN